MDRARALANAGQRRAAMTALLFDRACWVHDRLSAGRLAGLEPHEETITQDLLLDMCLAMPGLTIRALTKDAESREGADWEWWIEGGQGWFAMRIQAKRLYAPRRGGVPRYDINKKIERPDGTSSWQVDTFVSEADAARVPAVYALYNGADLPDPPGAWLCRSHPPTAGRLGVGVVPARRMRRLLHARPRRLLSLERLADEMLPWSCLTECMPGLVGYRTGSFDHLQTHANSWRILIDEDGGDQTAQWTAMNLADVFVRSASRSLSEVASSGDNSRDDASFEATREDPIDEVARGVRLSSEVPAYVRQVLDNEPVEAPPPGVRNLAVLQRE